VEQTRQVRSQIRLPNQSCKQIKVIHLFFLPTCCLDFFYYFKSKVETISEVPEESLNTSTTSPVTVVPQATTIANELFDLKIDSTVFNTPPTQTTEKWDPFGSTTTPTAFQPPPLPPMPIYQQYHQYNASIFATPQSPPQTPVSRTYNQQVNHTPLNTNETFESKWARLQANKKTTNPFAEDIAKKFEIKL
jgi:hypothetical protein